MKHNCNSVLSETSGSLIFCPHCNVGSMVYHFEWTALTCTECLADVDKDDWVILVNENN